MSGSVNVVLTEEQASGGAGEWGTNEEGIEFLFLTFPTAALARVSGGGLAVYLSGSPPTETGTES